MAESTTTRFGLHRWSADTDTVDRTEFDNTFAAVEANAALYLEGTRAARPAAGAGGRFYKVKGDATTAFNGMLFYDDGVAWVQVGGNVEDAVHRSSAAGTIPLLVRGSAGQSASLQEWHDSADAIKASISPGGNLTLAGSVSAGAGSFSGAVSVAGATTLAALSITTLQTSGDVTAYRLRSSATRADGGYQTEIRSDGTGRFDGLLPPGSIAWTLAAAAPAGWLLMQGQAVSRTTYVDLYNLIGTSYGSGDGSTTFNLPDWRGRGPVGLDASQTEFNALGKTGGAKTINLAHQHYIDHTHVVPGHNHPLSISYNCSLGGSSIRDNAGNTGQSGAFNTGTSNERPYSDSALGTTTILSPYITANAMVKV